MNEEHKHVTIAFVYWRITMTKYLLKLVKKGRVVRREINWLLRRNKMCHSAENDFAFVVLIFAIIMAETEWERERERWGGERGERERERI